MAAQDSTARPATILLLDADALAGIHLPLLREQYIVVQGQSISAAAEYLRRASSKCDFLISDIATNAEETFGLFRAVKSLVAPPTVLVTTADPGRVPDALLSGADAVLLKPFAPNLLFSRLGRLTQERGVRRQLATSRVVTVDSADVHCPRCNAPGAVTFDYLSHRRAWYACLACKKAWIARLTEK